jgi:flavodoxin
MKMLAACLLSLFILTLGCQQSDYQASIEPLVVKGVKNNSKALTVFYTRTGNTRLVAETIRDEFDCDLQEIKDLKDRSGLKGFVVGMIDVKTKKSTRINPEKLDLDEYDLIIICSPTWGMRLTPAITEFMKSADFKNKKVFVVAVAAMEMKAKTFKRIGDEIRSKEGNNLGNLLIKTMSNTPEEIKTETSKLIKDTVIYQNK